MSTIAGAIARRYVHRSGAVWKNLHSGSKCTSSACPFLYSELSKIIFKPHCVVVLAALKDPVDSRVVARVVRDVGAVCCGAMRTK
jgi:hypothetical protein